jgi:hypothetical protein
MSAIVKMMAKRMKEIAAPPPQSCPVKLAV